MREVTRVHVAKVSYDIEVEAKHELEAYIRKLEDYAADPEIMEDIEIRITELLSERKIEKNDVISVDDVAAIRARLGEPEDFAEDASGEEAGGSAGVISDRPRRRLYRDMDAAVIGGVLSGVGKYLGISPIWIRLIFLVGMIGSFGLLSVVYIVMWLVVPPARSATEKLELEGKLVTLESIRDKAAQTEQQADNPTPRLIGRILLFILGLSSVGMAIGAFAMTALVVFGISLSPNNVILSTVATGFEWVNWTVLTLFVLSGLLLCTLGGLVAHAAFTRRFSKKTGVAMVTIVLLGILSFGSGLVMMSVGSYYESQYLEKQTEEKKVDLDASFAGIKSLVASAHSVSLGGDGYEMHVEYVVDPGKPRYVLTSLPGIRVDVNVQDGQARVTLKSSREQNRVFHRVAQPRLVIYGPALDEIAVHQGNLSYSAGYGNQQDLALEVLPTATANLYGTYGKLTTKGGGRVSAESSTVYDLVYRQDSGSLQAGVVRSLDVAQADVCPAEFESSNNQVTVRGVASGKIIYNGSERTAQSVVRDCGTVVIGDDEIDNYEGDN